MPTAYQASRDFMARGIARVRAGIEGVHKGSGQPGPEITVDPFSGGNVSTPAALVKVASTILAARRRRANYDAANENSALEREKTRAEIARIRAATEYDLGTGRQPDAHRTEGLPPAKMTPASPVGNVPAGQPVDPRVVAAENARLNREATASRAARREASLHKYTIAEKAQRGLDADRENQIISAEAGYRAKVNGLLVDATSGDPKRKAAAVAALGFDPTETAGVGQQEANKRAIESLFQAFRTRKHAEYEKLLAPKRAALRAVIESEALNLAAPSEAAAAGGGDTTIEYDEQGNPISAGP